MKPKTIVQRITPALHFYQQKLAFASCHRMYRAYFPFRIFVRCIRCTQLIRRHFPSAKQHTSSNEITFQNAK